jgi:F-type H+-transporting ATPase subunit a
LAGLLPAGTNIFITPLLIVIELISSLAKFASLGIRLFANMFAGHLLLKVFYTLVFVTASQISILTTLFGLIIVFFTFFISVLEFLIAFLQAFVFFLLSTLYSRETIYFVGSH